MSSRFEIALRGYDRAEVDGLLARADAALAAPDEGLRASARELLNARNLTVVLRGYARDQVDDAIRERLAALGPAAHTTERAHAPSPFTIVLRGYDRAQVDATLAQADAATRSADVFARATARDALLAADFRVRVRGYARDQVDRAVAEAMHRLS